MLNVIYSPASCGIRQKNQTAFFMVEQHGVKRSDGRIMSHEVNDHLAAAVTRHPDRFAAFAALMRLRLIGICLAKVMMRAISLSAASRREEDLRFPWLCLCATADCRRLPV
jgi:hypothetical protein